MKPITVRLLKTNSKLNKTLIEDILPGALNGVLIAGYEFKFQYTKGDNKTRYPAIYVNSKSYHGLTEIQKGLGTIVSTNGARDVSDDQMHNYQLKGLWNDSNDKDSFEELSPDEIQQKTASFRTQRGTRDVENQNESSTVPAEVPAAQPVGPNVESVPKRQKQSAPGRGKVSERMKDNDIGATFAMMGNGSQDDELMENLFVNQQESPV